MKLQKKIVIHGKFLLTKKGDKNASTKKTQPVLTCLKLTKEAPGQCVNSAQN